MPGIESIKLLPSNMERGGILPAGVAISIYFLLLSTLCISVGKVVNFIFRKRYFLFFGCVER